MSAPAWFNARKAAQVAAFFANKQGEQIAVLKAVKLIYAADREHMRKFGHPILNDRLVSMPHGPANSLTLNFIDGNLQSERWDEFICDRAGYNISAQKKFSTDELDELSDAELQTLEEIWRRLGALDKWEIRDWTHDNCPEWEDPDGSSATIPHERVLKFLGHARANELALELESERTLEAVFSSIRS